MIVFGSRGSDLALTQTRHVAELLRRATGCEYRIDVIETSGDRILDRPLAAIGVKGAFTVELEQALREGRIDAAVHSLKDLPVDDPQGLVLGAVPERVDARDALVALPAWIDAGGGPLPLRAGARLGTSSPRRRAAALVAAPGVRVHDIRGNVPTRMRKVDAAGDYDGTLLAAAGLERLGLDLGGRVLQPLPLEQFTPAPGQGALAVQCRADDAATRALLAKIHDERAARCVALERDLLQRLGGGCSMPLGAHVEPDGDGFRLLASLFGGPAPSVVRHEARCQDPERAVAALAAEWAPLVGEPLHGVHVVLPRPDGEAGELAAALGVAGATVSTPAWTRTEPLSVSPSALDVALRAPRFAFTSARAVRAFATACEATGRNLPIDQPVFAVGPATARALAELGWHAHVPDTHSGEAVAARLREHGGHAVAFPCAAERHGALESACRTNGVPVTPLPLYRTVAGDAATIPPDAHAVLLTAPSSAEALWRNRSEGSTMPRIAIGETTAKAMAALDLPVAATAARATAADCIAALLRAGLGRGARA